MVRERSDMPRNSCGSSTRIIFEDWEWFDVSSALFQEGIARDMHGSEFKRYVALRYLANKHRSNVIQASLQYLEKLDGISPRRAHEVNACLEEMGMMEVDRRANPYRYRLYLPSEWHLLNRHRERDSPKRIPDQMQSPAW